MEVMNRRSTASDWLELRTPEGIHGSESDVQARPCYQYNAFTSIDQTVRGNLSQNTRKRRQSVGHVRGPKRRRKRLEPYLPMVVLKRMWTPCIELERVPDSPHA